MALSPISYICRSCDRPASVVPSRTFLGFRKTSCPNCQAPEKFPLTKGYRAAYLFTVALMVLTILMALHQDEIGFPGLIGVLVIAALVIDARIRKKTKPLLQ
jgi:hypothetical protein